MGNAIWGVSNVQGPRYQVRSFRAQLLPEEYYENGEENKRELRSYTVCQGRHGRCPFDGKHFLS